ncbi:MAG: phage tail tape measure protein, partial [Desulfobacterales bacterium]|nr:phage tail tape measure protein [Desulfobacterales bacterium]
LSMARAGATDLAMTSDIASNILSGFSLKAGQMTRVADVLTKTFTTSNVNLEELGETMKYVAPVATKAGLELEDMAAMAGLLGNVGIKGSESGTALRAMILRLAAPTGEAADALANMGVEARDSAGNIRPIIELLGEVAKETGNMGSGEQLEILKKIFGERPAASVSELIAKAGDQGITEYLKQIRAYQGTAKKTAAVMDDTLFGSVKRLGSAGEGLAISFGSRLTPAFRSVVDSVTWLTGKTIALTNRFPGLTTTVGLLAAGTVSLGAVMIAGGYAFTIVKGGVLGLQAAYLVLNSACLMTRGQMLALAVQQKAGAAATGIMTTAQWALNVALNANPIGLVVAGVAALAGAGVLVYKYWEPISGFFSGIWEKLKKMFSWMMKIRKFLPGFNDDQSRGAPGSAVQTRISTVDEAADTLLNKKTLSKQTAGTIRLKVSPTIHVGPGADQGQVRQAVNAGMGHAKDQMRTALQQIMHEERRLAYE